MTETVTFIIDPKGSFAKWQITSRDSDETVTAEDGYLLETSEGGAEPGRAGHVVKVKLGASPKTGYYFQFNGHTAFDLDYEGDALRYRTEPEVPGLLLNGNRITFDTTIVLLVMQRGAGPDNHVSHSMELDDLEQYKLNEAGTVFRLVMLKGSRIFLNSERIMRSGQVRTGGGHFKLLADGDLSKYVSRKLFEPAPGEALPKDVLIQDAYFAGRTAETAGDPMIMANGRYWYADFNLDDYL